MSEWKETTLGEIVDIIMGQSPPSETCNNNGDGVPLLNGPTEFGFNHPYPTQFTTYPKKIAIAGDLLFCVRGSTTGRMNWADQKYAIGRGIASIRAKQGVDLQPYIRAIIEHKLKELLASATGSTFPNISREQLLTLSFKCPSLALRKQISRIISIFDNKIDNLRRQNETLEKIAQTLFKHWFIDFEFPNDDGKPYKSSGGAMVASELGDIPEGWKVGKFSTFFDLLNGGTPKTSIAEYWDGNIKWLSVKDVTKNSRQFIIDTEKTITEKGIQKSAAKLLPKFTTIVSARGTVGNYCLLSEEMAISQSSFGVYPKGGNYVFYSYLLMSSLIQKLQSQAYGSVFDTVTGSTFNGLNIVLPELCFVREFEFKINPIFQKQLLNKYQIQTLTKTRDTLLPKLMSGQIRVKEVESIIEEVK